MSEFNNWSIPDEPGELNAHPDKRFYPLREGGIESKESKHPDLVEAMEKRGWNQSRTADFLGITRNQMSDWLQGKNIPDQFSPDLEQKFFLLTGKFPGELFRLQDPIELVHLDDVGREIDKKDFEEFGPKNLTEQEKNLMRIEIREVLHKSGLTSLQKDVLYWRFGLGEDGAEYTLAEIAKKLGLKSGERVRLIESTALRILRKSKNSDSLKSFIN